MKKSRRTVLKAAGALAGLGIFGVGYAPTLRGISKGWWAADKPGHRIYGNALEPEWRINGKTGELKANPDQYVANTVCVGCVSLCGVRVRVDKKQDKVLRVAGNPYHVLAADPYLPYDTPIKEGYKALSGSHESGLNVRATACGRGNAVLEKLYDPYRVLMPLKRVGPRNSGKWQPISFEKLIEEVVEGGDLFGEGEVEGLRAIRDVTTPIDPQRPELGPKSNQLACMAGFKEGRLPLFARFGKTSFGSVNFTGHRGNCGLSMRAGYAAFLDNFQGYPHLKPDFNNTEYLLNIGTAPANAGNPFMRQGKLVAEGRAAGRLKMVVVDPVLTNADSKAAGGQTQWVPIKPGTDGALVMAMLGWILENKRFNTAFLAIPGKKAAEAAGEPSWSNATHLVVVSEDHPRQGRFLRGTDLGLDDQEHFMAIDEGSGRPVPATVNKSGRLFVDEAITIDGREVAVKSSLQLLLEETQKHTLRQYSEACGVAEQDIIKLAHDFTSYGRRAVADCHGGTMHTNGFYTAYAVIMLNAMVGNLNWKGGTSAGGGRYPDFGQGPRYDFTRYPGMFKPQGVPISRQFQYEKTTEFKEKKAKGAPYPADGPWYPFSAAIQSEYIPSAFNGYPYPLKALIMWNTNPLYGQAGLYSQARDKMTDPGNLPLIISIDPFINESSAFADYIVPDTVLYESWGAAWPWAAHLTKTNSIRWPVVEPPLNTTGDNTPICMESFVIAAAKRMGLPGFGNQTIPDSAGKLHDFNRPEDFFLRVFANIALAGRPVADVTTEEMNLTGVERHRISLKSVLKGEEWPKVAYAMARGGRFEDQQKSYEGEWLGARYDRPIQIYNETVATNRNSLTGMPFSGVPTWMPPVFADGSVIAETYNDREWPFQVVSTKSQLQSSHTIGEARLRQIKANNGVIIHPDDAKSLRIRSGDRVRLISPTAAVEGVALVHYGIQRGVIGIEHGFGHWGLGASDVVVDGKKRPSDQARAAGVAHNLLGLADPSRRGVSTLADMVVGSNARQDIGVKVEKL